MDIFSYTIHFSHIQASFAASANGTYNMGRMVVAANPCIMEATLYAYAQLTPGYTLPSLILCGSFLAKKLLVQFHAYVPAGALTVFVVFSSLLNFLFLV